MEFTKCTLCLNKIPSNKKTEVKGNEDDAVQDQLQVIFLLRKFLKIPVDKCCDFLQDYGNPCSWINSCDTCSVLLEKGRMIFKQIMMLQDQFEKLQEEMKNKIILSAKDGNSEGGVIKIVRSFVCGGLFDTTSEIILPIKEEYVEDAETMNVAVNNQVVEYEQHPSIIYEPNDSLIYIPNSLLYKIEDCHSEERDNIQVDAIDDTELHIKEESQAMPLPEELNLYSDMILENDLQETLDSQEKEEEKTYKCNTCGNCFPKASSLKNHEKVHNSKIDRCQCHFCKKWFSNRYAFRRHLNTHTLERQHKCPFCGKFCTEAGNLQKHLRIHTGEKPYECKICGKSFTSSTYRNKHEKAHTQDTILTSS